MDGIAPFPPKNPPLKKGASRRKSMSLTSAGGMMAKRGSISHSKTGLYSSGMYSSKMMKGGTHGLGEKHGGGGGGRAHQVQVFDADGNDVTPLSLLPPPKPSGYKGGSHSILAEGAKSVLGSESAADFLNNLESMTIASQFNTSTLGRSMNASKASGASLNERDDDDASSLASAESDLEDDDAAVEYRKKEVEVKHFTEAELAAPVSILLQETETIWLLEIPGVSVASDSPDEAAVKSANEKYKELKATRSTNDNFVDRATQTFNLVSKNKDVQATVLKQAHAECMVNEWSIYDTFVSREVKSSDSGADIDQNKDASTGDDDSIDADARLSSAGPISASTLQSIRADSAMLSGSVSAIGPSMSMGTIDATGTTAQSIMNGDYGDSISVAGSAAADNLEGGRISSEAEVTLPDSIIDTLKLMEVNVTANNYLQKHVEYRDLPNFIAEKLKGDEQRANAADLQSANATKGRINEEEEKTDTFGSNLPTLQFLWSYRCDRTRDRTVNYLAWNKQNEDILAAAYSECQTYPNQSLGLILCWSLKNPEYPDRVYKADSPVTTIAFSSTNPNLLAAGFNDGRIAIYDIRNTTDRPVLDNGDLSGKHRDPVWELKWVEHERNIGDERSHGETLVSISTDGRVVQWLIRKGLEFTDLMTLKRITKQEGNKGGSSSGGAESSKSSSFISRQAGGLCFDFNGKDSNMYLAGTEDGHLHRCSCSYNEQYLDTYFGHTGPVYRVKWSPFYHQAFLSCSADWTARLWHQDNDEPVLKFQSGRDSITDVSWSPTCATVFGCVTRDGRIEIWDLQFSIIDPVILHSVLDRKLTAIVFAEESPVVLTGDDTGQINVYKLRNVQSGVGKTRDEKAEILAGVMRSKKQIPA